MTMPDMLELLKFLAPSLSADQDDRETAIDLAAGYRPACLPEALQDQAQALYAAWLLSMNDQQGDTTVIPVGVISEKEGDLSRTYGNAIDTLDSYGFKARYDLLADRCKSGVARMYRGACVK